MSITGFVSRRSHTFSSHHTKHMKMNRGTTSLIPSPDMSFCGVVHNISVKCVCTVAIVLALLMLPRTAASAPREQTFALDRFLSENVRLNNVQIDSVHHGKPVATVLDSRIPDEVFVFGIIYIEAKPQSYLEFAN